MGPTVTAPIFTLLVLLVSIVVWVGTVGVAAKELEDTIVFLFDLFLHELKLGCELGARLG